MDQVNVTRRLPITFRIVLRGPRSAGDPPPVLWVLDSGLDPESWASADIEIAPDGKDRLLAIKTNGDMYTRYGFGGKWEEFRKHGSDWSAS